MVSRNSTDRLLASDDKVLINAAVVGCVQCDEGGGRSGIEVRVWGFRLDLCYLFYNAVSERLLKIGCRQWAGQ
jgi:hypothetical protein